MAEELEQSFNKQLESVSRLRTRPLCPVEAGTQRTHNAVLLKDD